MSGVLLDTSEIARAFFGIFGLHPNMRRLPFYGILVSIFLCQSVQGAPSASEVAYQAEFIVSPKFVGLMEGKEIQEFLENLGFELLPDTEIEFDPSTNRLSIKQVPTQIEVIRSISTDKSTAQPGPNTKVYRKLSEIVVPSINFSNMTFREAVEYLRTLADLLDRDPVAAKPSKSIPLPDGGRFSIHMENVKLGVAIRYIALLSEVEYAVDPDAGLIASSIQAPKFVCSVPTPKSFRTLFDVEANVIDALPVLKNSEIEFPEGSKATYLPTLDELVLVTSPAAARQVAELALLLLRDEPTPTLRKLFDIVLPRVEFKNVSVSEALRFLERQSQIHDTSEELPLGIKIRAAPDILQKISNIRLDLSLTDVPLFEAIKCTMSLAGLSFSVKGVEGVVLSLETDPWMVLDEAEFVVSSEFAALIAGKNSKVYLLSLGFDCPAESRVEFNSGTNRLSLKLPWKEIEVIRILSTKGNSNDQPGELAYTSSWQLPRFRNCVLRRLQSRTLSILFNRER